MSRVNQLYSNDVDHLNLGVCLPLKMICQISDVYFWTDKMFYSSELKTLIVKESKCKLVCTKPQKTLSEQKQKFRINYIQKYVNFMFELKDS